MPVLGGGFRPIPSLHHASRSDTRTLRPQATTADSASGRPPLTCLHMQPPSYPSQPTPSSPLPSCSTHGNYFNPVPSAVPAYIVLDSQPRGFYEQAAPTWRPPVRRPSAGSSRLGTAPPTNAQDSSEGGGSAWRPTSQMASVSPHSPAIASQGIDSMQEAEQFEAPQNATDESGFALSPPSLMQVRHYCMNS